MTVWPLVPLGELLKKSDEWVKLDALATITQVRVRWWGHGAVARRTATAGELGSDQWLVVRENQFLISRIDARKGAAGVVPRSLDGAFVSNDFPAFNIDSKRLEPQFLDWYSKTPHFIDECTAASEGTTNRVRLKEDRFYTITMPLPPIEEQRRIVARIEGLAQRVSMLSEAQESVRRESDLLLQAARAKIFENMAQSGTIPLCEAALLERGRFSHRPRNDPRFFGGVHPWIQIGLGDHFKSGHVLSLQNRPTSPGQVH